MESYFSKYDYLPKEFINFILEKYVKKTEYKDVAGKEVEYALEHAVVIDSSDNNGKVGIGCQVELQYEDEDDVETYKIVGSQEADPFNNKISNESPMALAIMGKKVGETVEVSSPDGVYSVKIVAIG